MFLIFQRLVLSILTIFLFQQPTMLVYITLSVHSLYFLFNLMVRPYRNLGVDGIAIGTGGGIVATCSMGVVIVVETDRYINQTGNQNVNRDLLSPYVGILVLVLDVIVPIITTCFMMYLQKRKNQRMVAPLGVEMGEKGDEKQKEEGEEKKEDKPLDVVDIIINEFTLKTMSNFFVVVGVLAFISLAIAIVGILNSNSNLPVVAPILGKVLSLFYYLSFYFCHVLIICSFISQGMQWNSLQDTQVGQSSLKIVVVLILRLAPTTLNHGNA